KPGEALPAFERSTSPYFRLAGAAVAHHSLGHAAQSQQALDELIDKYGHSAAYQIAGVYAWRGDKDRTFEWLDRAYAQHDAGLEPGLRAGVARLSLPDGGRSAHDFSRARRELVRRRQAMRVYRDAHTRHRLTRWILH